MQTALQDLRYALRQLRRNPGFTAVAVLTLALGIGVNAAMFTVLYAVLLRPLPYPQADRIVHIESRRDGQGDFAANSVLDMRDWQSRSRSFEQIAYYDYSRQTSLHLGSAVWQASPVSVSTNLLQVLNVQPILGRAFLPGEDLPGKSQVAVISSELWQSVFHGDPSALGKQVILDGDPYTVIGVMPRGFAFPADEKMQLWTALEVPKEALENRGERMFQAIGRLKPGVSVQQSQTELTGIQAAIANSYGKLELANRVVAQTYRDTLTSEVRPAILSLYAAVALVWLIACVNIVNLLLARTTTRRREIAVRGALGASRWRLARQFLTETLLLSLIGSSLGLVFAVVAIKTLWISISRYLPLTGYIHINVPVLAALFVLSVLSALITGIVPALQASRTAPQEGMREGSLSTGSSRSNNRLRDVLVIGEIALTMVLLVSAGLLLRTLYALHHAPLGFTRENIVTTAIFFPHKDGVDIRKTGDYPAGIDQAVYQPLRARLRAIPGVQSAALSSVVPMGGQFQVKVVMRIPGVETTQDKQPAADMRIASPGMTDTLGIRMLQGRFFRDSDTASAPTVVVINQAFANKYFPSLNPIGRELAMDKTGRLSHLTIVGIIDDVKQTSVKLDTTPEVYFCTQQITPETGLYGVATAFMQIAVRTRVAPTSVIPAIRTAVKETAPGAVLAGEIQTMEERIEDSIGSQTFAAHLLWLFAGAALLIAIAGIYGLLAYSVSQRTREIGIRIALGAQPGSVQWMILRHAVTVVAVGLAIGIASSFAATRLVRSYLFGVEAHDAATILTVALLLVACGVFAGYLPARRAASTDPMVALRSE